jgi:hypothetical protein
MVHRMLKRGAYAAPLVIIPFFIWGGVEAGISAALGLAMALANLYLAGRIIGGVAESNPKLLLAGAMVAFMAGLALLVLIALGLEALDLVVFKVTGLVLVGSHMVLVLWEAKATPVRNVATGNGPLKAKELNT